MQSDTPGGSPHAGWLWPSLQFAHHSSGHHLKGHAVYITIIIVKPSSTNDRVGVSLKNQIKSVLLSHTGKNRVEDCKWIPEREYKYLKNASLSKDMSFIFLQGKKIFEKQAWWEKGYYVASDDAPDLQFAGFKRLVFSKSQSSTWKLHPPFAIYESTERFLVWPFDSWGAQCGAPSWGFLQHVQWWVDEILSPPSTVMGLFRLGTASQEPQPAWTISTFNNF